MLKAFAIRGVAVSGALPLEEADHRGHHDENGGDGRVFGQTGPPAHEGAAKAGAYCTADPAGAVVASRHR
ncbi:hypothetical protein [Tomitella cavernea]|uniref:hypothetical protein n=1 Tax=Tomitella cavernea TaxID=1387982 RepID=UPI001904C2E8|nr:hypothetical protein [Tomitella cavernea]